jgi:hypothetical protein
MRRDCPADTNPTRWLRITCIELPIAPNDLFGTRAERFVTFDDIPAAFFGDDLKSGRVDHQPHSSESPAVFRRMRDQSKMQPRTGCDFKLSRH